MYTTSLYKLSACFSFVWLCCLFTHSLSLTSVQPLQVSRFVTLSLLGCSSRSIGTQEWSSRVDVTLKPNSSSGSPPAILPRNSARLLAAECHWRATYQGQATAPGQLYRVFVHMGNSSVHGQGTQPWPESSDPEAVCLWMLLRIDSATVLLVTWWLCLALHTLEPPCGFQTVVWYILCLQQLISVQGTVWRVQLATQTCCTVIVCVTSWHWTAASQKAGKQTAFNLPQPDSWHGHAHGVSFNVVDVIFCYYGALLKIRSVIQIAVNVASPG